ncbi:phosphatidylinositol-specific phospholipase C1-like protein [Asaia sp. As-1742]|uniref:phosphatidylinositol-specific phospholipase C1-like protein n=1 Tax=Asaia sp. As-1742 TaxID=2608325 RepID=UPI001F039E31|nr:phosphatidylinositol-specific phospholipase C1-like protein [Asaia sp. As-1742]
MRFRHLLHSFPTISHTMLVSGLVSALTTVGFASAPASWAQDLAPLKTHAVSHTVDDAVHVNQIQVIGTHNSYRRDISPVTLQWLTSLSPQAAVALDYHHDTLTAQLDHGVRQLEIDIYADTQGGRYAHPKGGEWERKAGLTPDADPTPAQAMQGTDFKVMHIVDIDQRSSCQPFRACLEQIKAWSDAHPNHVPVFIDLETKQDIPFGGGKLPFTPPEVFTPATYDRLDAELVAVFGRDRIITPDDVRGDAPTLDEGVRKHGWPALSQARGKIVFLFDRPHDTARYVKDHPALRNRIVFTNAHPGDPDCGFTEVNEGFIGAKGNGSDAVDNKAAATTIPALVKQGYLVRTRADANTIEARQNALERRDVAFSSGAQLISTDYPTFEPAPWHNYSVGFGQGLVARCNPVNAPASCRSSALEP